MSAKRCPTVTTLSRTLSRTCSPRCASAVVMLVASAATPGQVPADGWVTGTIYHTLIVHDAGFSWLASMPGRTDRGGITVDDRGEIFSGVYDIWSMHYDPSRIPPLPQSPSILTQMPVTLVHLAVARDRLWLITWEGNIAHLDKVTPYQTPTYIGNARIAAGITGGITSMCTDGREAFLSVEVTASDTHHLFALDLRSSPLSIRPVTSFPRGSSRRMGPSLVLARDGDLLAMDQDFLYRVDARNGTKTVVEPRPVALNPGGSPSQIVVAYDPWSDVVAISPTWYFTSIYTRTLSNGPFTLVHSFFPDVTGKMATTSEQPFELFGKGCTNGLGLEPRLGWQDLPLQGNTFTLKLRQAEPNGFAMFWLGLSDTFWLPVGPLPFEAAPFGAPGCRLLVSADVPYLVFVDGSGQASLRVSVPSNAALHGFEVFAQTASTSGGNALGFATSDAVVIRLR